MTRRQHREFGHVLRADPDGDGPIRFVAATEGRKADGLDLRMDSVDLERFLANPVIGYGHDYFGRESLPIGRAEDTFVDGSRLLMDVIFDSRDDFAATVERKVRQGFISAMSVGFKVDGVDEHGVPDSWELFESSVVPIPLDAKALAESPRAALRQMRAYITRREAIAAHSTPTVDDEPWDGPGAVAEAPNDAEVLRYMHAWVDPNGDPDTKQAYSFPHHGPRQGAAANLNAVRNALARLPQADIPDGDRDRVEAHLRRHLDDADDSGEPTQHTCPSCGRQARGASLASFLNGRIDELVDDDTSRADIVARMAREADISESTVNQILQADIDCPPLARLEGFARALDVSVGAVVGAAEDDGCEYDRAPRLTVARQRLHVIAG